MKKMKQCKSCSKEIASSAKVCPGCGAKNKKPIYKRAWFIVIVLLILVGAINAAGGGNSTTPNSGTNENGQVENSTAKKEKFELVGEVETETDQFATYLKGIIKNNSGKDCSYVQVTFNLYDAEGNQIGTALDNINNLEADGTWKFKAMGIDVDGEIASYKLAEITGF